MQLSSRLLRLLDLLLDPGQPAPKGAATLRALARTDGTTAAPIELPTLVRSWLPLLVRGYEEGVRLSAAVPLGVVKHRHEQQIEAELRSTATELISAGADPRGLTADAVPLIAYSLLIETLPTAIDADSAEAADKFNILLLGMPEDVASIPSEQRRLFIELLKLALMLGEAQAFADQLSLNRLSLDQDRPSTGTSSYMIGIGLLVVGVAVIGLLLGLAIGKAQSPARAGAHARTITRTETVSRTRTIVHNQTTTVTAPRAASSHPGNGSRTRYRHGDGDTACRGHPRGHGHRDTNGREPNRPNREDRSAGLHERNRQRAVADDDGGQRPHPHHRVRSASESGDPCRCEERHGRNPEDHGSDPGDRQHPEPARGRHRPGRKGVRRWSSGVPSAAATHDVEMSRRSRY